VFFTDFAVAEAIALASNESDFFIPALYLPPKSEGWRVGNINRTEGRPENEALVPGLGGCERLLKV